MRLARIRRCRGASVSVAGAVVPPAIGILGVVQPVELVGVVVQAIGGRLGLVIVLAVVAGRSRLLGALADKVKLLARQLDDLFKSLFNVHFGSFRSPGSVG